MSLAIDTTHQHDEEREDQLEEYKNSEELVNMDYDHQRFTPPSNDMISSANSHTDAHNRKKSSNRDKEVASPLQAYNKKDRIESSHQMKLAGYEHIKFWDEKRKKDLILVKNLTDSLQDRIEEANRQIHDKNELLRDFYIEFLETFDNTSDKTEKLFKERVKVIHEKQKKSEKIDLFDEAILGIVQAEESRKKRIQQYKQKQSDNVLRILKEDLLKNKIVMSCINDIKTANKLKKNLAIISSNALAALSDFSVVFKEGNILNSQKKIVKRDNFWYCYSFAITVKKLTEGIQQYSKLVISLIETSRSKEIETMLAIKKSFENFYELNQTYFGSEINSHYQYAMRHLEKLGNQTDNQFDTFNIDKQLVDKELDFIRHKLNIDSVDNVKDLYNFVELLDNDEEIWNHLIRLQADVEIIGGMFSNFILGANQKCSLYLTMDDFIYQIDMKKNEKIHSFKLINCKIIDMEAKDCLEQQWTEDRFQWSSTKKVQLKFADKRLTEAFKILFHEAYTYHKG